MTLIAVLVKDMADAKQRLTPVLDPESRRQLAEAMALRALTAASATGATIAICGSVEAAELARSIGVEAIVEQPPSGQNEAARQAITCAVARGIGEVLVLSSDLPLVDSAALADLIATAARIDGPVIVAAAAEGRNGTNALLLRPPSDVDVHFGENSLPKYRAEASLRGRTFVAFEDGRLALDLDVAADLERWLQLEPSR